MTSNYKYDSCNHKPVNIIDIDGVSYYGADAYGVELFEGDLVINLTRSPNKTNTVPELSKFMELSFEEMMIPWPDFGLPKVKIEFWEALHNYIIKKGYKSVCFHCMGGHGRTGTAIASMLIVNGGWGAKETVDFLRDSFCKKMVETDSQCMYLTELDIVYNGADADPNSVPKASWEQDDKKKYYQGWGGYFD